MVVNGIVLKYACESVHVSVIMLLEDFGMKHNFLLVAIFIGHDRSMKLKNMVLALVIRDNQTHTAAPVRATIAIGSSGSGLSSLLEVNSSMFSLPKALFPVKNSALISAMKAG
jgi:hypothetical protein